MNKKILAIASLIIGIVGLGVFQKPVLEIICGVGGLVLAILAKDKEESYAFRLIRNWGSYFAGLNIVWVCIEMVLKFFDIDVFGN